LALQVIAHFFFELPVSSAFRPQLPNASPISN
jgi:hypothetical protein